MPKTSTPDQEGEKFSGTQNPQHQESTCKDMQNRRLGPTLGPKRMQQRSWSVSAVPWIYRERLGPTRLAVQHKNGCAYGRAAIKLGRGCAKVSINSWEAQGTSRSLLRGPRMLIERVTTLNPKPPKPPTSALATGKRRVFCLVLVACSRISLI